jgi:hypothetical protein
MIRLESVSLRTCGMVVLLECLASLAPPVSAAQPPGFVVFPPRELKEQLAQMSGGGQDALASALGVTEVAGKSLNASPGGPGRANAKKLTDVPVGARPDRDENEPTVAANPVDRDHLIAGNHFFPQGGVNRCVAYTSSDRGARWSDAIVLPQLSAVSTCSDPVLAYAPDGSRAYYSYMDIKTVTDLTNFPAFFTRTFDWDIVVSHSDDNGATWSAPHIALNADPYTVTFTPCPVPPFPPGSYCGVITDPGYAFDKNWVGAHIDEENNNWVYVSATRFDTPGFSNIVSAGSADQGLTWGAPVVHDSGNATTVVQGSRPKGGVGGEVLVVWYHSGTDGWLTGNFQIRTRRSPDHGATWESRVVAANDSSELPFWLGPFTFYKRWWGAMFPDVEFDEHGEAHVVYTHDPSPNGACPPIAPSRCSTDTEDGDIRYITSAGAPYTVWSPPETVSDDTTARSQGYAALAVEPDGHAHVIWEDTRRGPDVAISDPVDCFTTPAGPCESPNMLYDIFYSQKTPGEPGWFANFRVNDTPSLQDFVFTGDYTDLAANQNVLFGIWTDRRHSTSIFSGSDNTFGSRITAGGASRR